MDSDGFETIQELERDGWKITVEIAPDWEYQPGEDDDIYPRLQELSPYQGVPDRDYDGRFIPQPIIVTSRQGPIAVSVDEIRRLIEAGGINPRTARAQIRSDAAAIAGEQLSWVVIRVTATLGDHAGTDYLSGVEYDLRQRQPEGYALETVRDYDMPANAIQEAARATLGDMATLALSY